MSSFIPRVWSAGIVGNFLAGLFLILPIAVTVIILNWLIEKIASVLGPGSLLGDLLLSGGGTIVGSDHAKVAYLIGFVIAVGIIWLIGLLVKAKARKQVDRGIDLLFNRVPVIRSVYKPVAQVVRLISGNEGRNLKAMRVVMCRFGGDQGTDVLALLTTPYIYTVRGQRRQLVYLPTSPLPMSGGLVFVPPAKIEPVPGLEVDDLMKIYFSLGALAPDVASKSLSAQPPA